MEMSYPARSVSGLASTCPPSGFGRRVQSLLNPSALVLGSPLGGGTQPFRFDQCVGCLLLGQPFGDLPRERFRVLAAAHRVSQRPGRAGQYGWQAYVGRLPPALRQLGRTAR